MRAITTVFFMLFIFDCESFGPSDQLNPVDVARAVLLNFLVLSCCEEAKRLTSEVSHLTELLKSRDQGQAEASFRTCLDNLISTRSALSLEMRAELRSSADSLRFYFSC